MARARAADGPDVGDRGAVRRAFDWAFRDRRTGKVVVAQWPNRPLWVFIGAALVRAVVHPAGTIGTVVSAVAALALLWWAIDEVARGVNPFRRALGAVVAVMTVLGALMR